MPTVRLVTPTDKLNNASIDAFEDELQNNNNLGWDNITQVYSAVDYGDASTTQRRKQWMMLLLPM